MKKILYSTVAIATIIGYIAITKTQTEIQFKPDLEFEYELQKQIAGIKEKQDELIQAYDFIISNKTESVESK